jgi:cytochrome c biogenesis factor
MMLAVFLAALLITLLGVAYVKGYDMVKSRSPEHLPHFYLIMATVRMLLIGTAVVLYVLFADSREDAVRFALIILILYAAMMVTTLTMRH